jgi:hypothetical protein
MKKLITDGEQKKIECMFVADQWKKKHEEVNYHKMMQTTANRLLLDSHLLDLCDYLIYCKLGKICPLELIKIE